MPSGFELESTRRLLTDIAELADCSATAA